MASLLLFLTLAAGEGEHRILRDAMKKEPEPKDGGPDFTNWDWRDHGAVTPIRHQSFCGSCWAFAAIAALEGRNFVQNGNLIPLSEKHVLDCVARPITNLFLFTHYPGMEWTQKLLDRFETPFMDADGCEGANTAVVFLTMAEKGFATRESYLTYDVFDAANMGKAHKCPPESDFKSPLNPKGKFERVATLEPGIDSWKDFGKESTNEELMQEILHNGPCTIALYMGDDDAIQQEMSQYDGSYPWRCTKGTHQNHAMAVIGYGVTDEGEAYWLVKNSHGKMFGKDGFMMVSQEHCPLGYDHGIKVACPVVAAIPQYSREPRRNARCPPSHPLRIEGPRGLQECAFASNGEEVKPVSAMDVIPGCFVAPSGQVMYNEHPGIADFDPEVEYPSLQGIQAICKRVGIENTYRVEDGTYYITTYSGFNLRGTSSGGLDVSVGYEEPERWTIKRLEFTLNEGRKSGKYLVTSEQSGRQLGKKKALIGCDSCDGRPELLSNQDPEQYWLLTPIGGEYIITSHRGQQLSFKYGTKWWDNFKNGWAVVMSSHKETTSERWTLTRYLENIDCKSEKAQNCKHHCSETTDDRQCVGSRKGCDSCSQCIPYAKCWFDSDKFSCPKLPANANTKGGSKDTRAKVSPEQARWCCLHRKVCDLPKKTKEQKTGDLPKQEQ